MTYTNIYGSFKDLMKVSMKDIEIFIKKDNDWKIIANKYDTANKNIFSKVKIPLLIHQIWLGPKPLPEKHNLFRASWKKNHPDWKYKLWMDSDIKNFNFINKTAFDKATNYGEKSDILRYEILYKYGGLYVDDDFECLQPFDALHYLYDFYTGLAPNGRLEMYNGLIGSSAENFIIKNLCYNIGKKKGKRDSFDSIMHRTGPYYFTKIILDSLRLSPNFNFISFPSQFFYPWPSKDRFNDDLFNIKKYITKNSMAIHYWATSWQKK